MLPLPFSFIPVPHLFDMSENDDIWTCPQCGMRQDVSQLGFFVEIACPQCGNQSVVHTKLANYQIESVLGIGGMSMVFRAFDLVLGRPIAIKVLNETYRHEAERVAGIENECSLMAKVRHENVVSVYSAGWARGQFYIAMELVEGRNLELIVAERGSLLPADALEIVHQVAQGLQAAHMAGLLHRDVKPGNVIITTEGSAKVLDFGLSLEDSPGSEVGDIIWATPYYAPPETLLREQESVQTDIYALGMTLRNLLTGESALPGAPQTVEQMLEAKKKLPDISTLLPHAVPELSHLVQRMTAYAISERPAGYAELLLEVEATQKAMAAVLNPELRERRYRRKLYSSAGILGCTVLGMLGGFMVALLTPSETIQDVLDADALRWVERDSYAAALTELQAARYEESARLLAELGNAPGDPAVTAAAIFVRTAFQVLEDKMADNGYKRFDELVGNADAKLSPAGRVSLSQLAALADVIRKDASHAAERADQLPDSLIKVAAMILVADQYVRDGLHAQAEETIIRTMDMLTACQADALRELLDEYRMAAPRRAARVALVRLHEMYKGGDWEQADSLAAELLKLKLGRLEKEELRVLSEVSDIMQVALESLPHALPADATPDQWQQQAYEGTLPRELACLVHLLRGEYDQAFSMNPYAGGDSDNEPFAVMMRDWKKRLEK